MTMDRGIVQDDHRESGRPRRPWGLGTATSRFDSDTKPVQLRPDPLTTADDVTDAKGSE